MNYKNNIVMEKVSKERTRRVLEQLAHLKESISSAALGYLKKTFEVSEEMQGDYIEDYEAPLWVDFM